MVSIYFLRLDQTAIALYPPPGKTLKYKNVSYSGVFIPQSADRRTDYANWDVMVGGWGTEAASGNPLYAYAQQ